MRQYAKIDGTGFHLEDGITISEEFNRWNQSGIRIIHELSKRAEKLEVSCNRLSFLRNYSDNDIDELLYEEDGLISILLNDPIWFNIGEIFRDFQAQLKQELIELRENNE